MNSFGIAGGNDARQFRVPHGPNNDALVRAHLRKCIWSLLLVTSWTIIRLLEVKHQEILLQVQQGGAPDTGPPPPWEAEEFVGANGSFEATLLSPLDPGASTFMRHPGVPGQEGSTLVFAAGQGLVAQAAPDGPLLQEEAAQRHQPVTAEPLLLEGGCGPGILNGTATGSNCFVGAALSKGSAAALLARGGPAGLVCYSLLAGASADDLWPLEAAAQSGRLCVQGARVTALVALPNSSVLVTWEVRAGRARPRSCVARVRLPSLEVGPATMIDQSPAFFYDEQVDAVVAVGFSPLHRVVTRVLDAATLSSRGRYELPLTTGWLLRSRISRGYVLLIGADEPLAGAAYVVDLSTGRVTQQLAPPPGLEPWAAPRQRLSTTAWEKVDERWVPLRSGNLRGSERLRAAVETASSKDACVALVVP